VLRRRPVFFAAAAALTTTLLVSAWPLSRALRSNSASALDPGLVVVFPFRRPAGSTTHGEEEVLRRALANWNEIRVVDPARLSAVMSTADTAPLSVRAARKIARRLTAGRFVLTEMMGDSSGQSQIRATVYNAANADSSVATVRKADQRVYAPEPVFRRLAEAILFPGLTTESAGNDEDTPATRSIDAHRDYLIGRQAFERRDLSLADSLLRAAVVHDPAYARAHFLIAQLGLWTSSNLARYEDHARLALAGQGTLNAHDRRIADAILMMTKGDFARGCALMGLLTRDYPFDFTSWYGLAQCLRRDNVVVRSAASPSGWAFRSSYERAVQAYRRALQLDPNIRLALRPAGYLQVRQFLWTSGSTLTRPLV
jgi:tetratricopeptide (TPR) repeat protein